MGGCPSGEADYKGTGHGEKLLDVFFVHHHSSLVEEKYPTDTHATAYKVEFRLHDRSKGYLLTKFVYSANTRSQIPQPTDNHAVKWRPPTYLTKSRPTPLAGSVLQSETSIACAMITLAEETGVMTYILFIYLDFVYKDGFNVDYIIYQLAWFLLSSNRPLHF